MRFDVAEASMGEGIRFRRVINKSLQSLHTENLPCVRVNSPVSWIAKYEGKEGL